MRGLTSDEAAAVERVAGEPMLAQVEAWAAVNSGSRGWRAFSPTPSPSCRAP
jgi:hypothetical protein